MTAHVTIILEYRVLASVHVFVINPSFLSFCFVLFLHKNCVTYTIPEKKTKKITASSHA